MQNGHLISCCLALCVINAISLSHGLGSEPSAQSTEPEGHTGRDDLYQPSPDDVIDDPHHRHRHRHGQPKRQQQHHIQQQQQQHQRQHQQQDQETSVVQNQYSPQKDESHDGSPSTEKQTSAHARDSSTTSSLENAQSLISSVLEDVEYGIQSAELARSSREYQQGEENKGEMATVIPDYDYGETDGDSALSFLESLLEWFSKTTSSPDSSVPLSSTTPNGITAKEPSAVTPPPPPSERTVNKDHNKEKESLTPSFPDLSSRQYEEQSRRTEKKDRRGGQFAPWSRSEAELQETHNVDGHQTRNAPLMGSRSGDVDLAPDAGLPEPGDIFLADEPVSSDMSLSDRPARGGSRRNRKNGRGKRKSRKKPKRGNKGAKRRRRKERRGGNSRKEVDVQRRVALTGDGGEENERVNKGDTGRRNQGGVRYDDEQSTGQRNNDVERKTFPDLSSDMNGNVRYDGNSMQSTGHMTFDHEYPDGGHNMRFPVDTTTSANIGVDGRRPQSQRGQRGQYQPVTDNVKPRSGKKEKGGAPLEPSSENQSGKGAKNNALSSDADLRIGSRRRLSTGPRRGDITVHEELEDEEGEGEEEDDEEEELPGDAEPLLDNEEEFPEEVGAESTPTQRSKAERVGMGSNGDPDAFLEEDGLNSWNGDTDDVIPERESPPTTGITTMVNELVRTVKDLYSHQEMNRQNIKELFDRHRSHRTDLHLTEGKVAILDQNIRGLTMAAQTMEITSVEMRNEMADFRNRQHRSERNYRRLRTEVERMLGKIKRLEDGYRYINGLHKGQSVHMTVSSEVARNNAKLDKFLGKADRLERLDTKRSTRTNRLGQKLDKLEGFLDSFKVDLKVVSSQVKACSKEMGSLRGDVMELENKVETSISQEFLEVLRSLEMGNMDAAMESATTRTTVNGGGRNGGTNDGEDVGMGKDNQKTPSLHGKTSTTESSYTQAPHKSAYANGHPGNKDQGEKMKLRISRHLDSSDEKEHDLSKIPVGGEAPGFNDKTAQSASTGRSESNDDNASNEVEGRTTSSFVQQDSSHLYPASSGNRPTPSGYANDDAEDDKDGSEESNDGQEPSQVLDGSDSQKNISAEAFNGSNIFTDELGFVEMPLENNGSSIHSQDEMMTLNITRREDGDVIDENMNNSRLLEAYSGSVKPNVPSKTVLKPTPTVTQDGVFDSPSNESDSHQNAGTIAASNTDVTASTKLSTSFSSTETQPTRASRFQIETPTPTTAAFRPNSKPAKGVETPSSPSQTVTSHHNHNHNTESPSPKPVVSHQETTHATVVHRQDRRQFDLSNAVLQRYIHKLEDRIRTLESSMLKLNSSTIPGLKAEVTKALVNHTSSLTAEMVKQDVVSTNQTSELRRQMDAHHNASYVLQEKLQSREMDLLRLKTITGRTSAMLSDLANQVSSINMTEFISRLQLSLANFSQSVLTVDQWRQASGQIINTTLDHEVRISQLYDGIRVNTEVTSKLQEKLTSVQSSTRRWYRSLQGHVIRLNNTLQDFRDKTDTRIQQQAKHSQSSQPSQELQSKMDSLHIQLLYNSNRLSTLETSALNRSLEQCRRTAGELELQAVLLRQEKQQAEVRKDFDLMQEKIQRIDMSVYRLHGNTKTNDDVMTKLASDVRHLTPVTSQVLRLEKEVANLLHQVPKDCHEYFIRGYRASREYIIYPKHLGRSIRVYCVMEDYPQAPSLDLHPGNDDRIISDDVARNADNARRGDQGEGSQRVDFVNVIHDANKNDDNDNDNDNSNDEDDGNAKTSGARRDLTSSSSPSSSSVSSPSLSPRHFSRQTKEEDDFESSPLVDDSNNNNDEDDDDNNNNNNNDNNNPTLSQIYNGGWTVIQRRYDGRLNFSRSWVEYAMGFGSSSGEHWLGNDVTHLLTNQDAYECRVVMTDVFGGVWEARYDHFRLGGQDDNFRLEVSGYHGNASDGLGSSNQMAFSTMDRDNDASSSHCAVFGLGGWWYRHCHVTNLNGAWDVGMVWFNRAWRDWIQMKASVIMVKPRDARHPRHHNPQQ